MKLNRENTGWEEFYCIRMKVVILMCSWRAISSLEKIAHKCSGLLHSLCYPVLRLSIEDTINVSSTSDTILSLRQGRTTIVSYATGAITFLHLIENRYVFQPVETWLGRRKWRYSILSGNLFVSSHTKYIQQNNLKEDLCSLASFLCLMKWSTNAGVVHNRCCCGCFLFMCEENK